MDKLHWILLIIAFGSFATVVMLGLIMGRSSSERASCGNVSKGEKPAKDARIETLSNIFNRIDEYAYCSSNPVNLTLNRLERDGRKKIANAYSKALFLGKAQDKPKLIAESGDWHCISIHGVVVGATPVEAYEIYLKMIYNKGT
ncbi:hypothetical protein [Pseudoalteromonas phage C7]|uniref:hypothetical protein n=1 Tax=Pseudoalteromonas phage C7 TaxID=2510494 RepID=UPI0010172C6D|nr:hypothetical protein PP587_gp18 [Pseudoalteromonas phage C7]QAY17972.1 hypothetical protein [Pseudoalteromonas phage C7]